MHVHDETQLVGGDHGFREPRRFEQQLASFSGVAVGLGHSRCLRRVFNDAIGKNLHTRDRQVRDVLEPLPESLNVGQFLCWLEREDLWKGYDMGYQLSLLR